VAAREHGKARGLSASEALAAISRLVDANPRVILVGGQALNFWAERYRAKDRDLGRLAPFESEDIDFLGTADDAKLGATILNGKARFPTQDHVNTPEVGVVEFKLQNRERRIDFLGYLAGLERAKVEKRAVSTTHDDRSFRVMHPLHVLTSRIANIIQLRRRDSLALRQARAAIRVMREYIREAANKSPRVALRNVEDAFHLALSKEAMAVWYEHGIDVAHIFMPYEGLPANFKQTRLPRLLSQLQAKRDKYKRRRDKAA